VASDFVIFQDYCLPVDSFCGNLSGIVDLVTASMKPPDQSSGSVNQSVMPVRSVPEQSGGLAVHGLGSEKRFCCKHGR